MKKKYQIALVTIGCLIALIGLSYAYFVATSKGGGPGGSTTVNTVTIDEVGFSIEGELEFDDLDILPGHKNVSKIKATAIGKDDIISYKLVWEGINTLNTPLKYYVYKTVENENPSITCNKETEIKGTSKIYYETCNENNFDNLGSMITSGEITKTETNTEFVLANEEVIKGTKEGNIVYYYIVLEYPNLNESQNIDMGGSFDGMLTVKKLEDTLVDLNIKKIYQETDTGYQAINRMPDNGYTINTEKSTCSNGATPTYRNNKILITNLTSSNTECEIYFDKDKIAPTIANMINNVTENSITVKVEASDNIGVTEYWYAIDSDDFTKGDSDTKTFTSLGIGSTHIIKVYVKDAAGNQSDITTKEIQTTPDTTIPVITNVSTSVTKTEITVTVSAHDNNGTVKTGVAEYYYQIDSGTPVKKTTNTHIFTGLAAGSTHTINVYVKDGAGNQSSIYSKSNITTTVGTINETILNSVSIKTNTPSFANIATTDEGVYSVSDGMYGGTSYYWRGATTNNYVTFAGFCWRIIRINGDGSMRLIYDGTTCHANGANDANSIALTGRAYNTSYNRSEYVGWTYSTGSQRTTSGTSSNIKTQTERWFTTNITGTNAEKVASGKFCNDRNTGSGYSWSSQPSSTFYYAGYDRSGAKSASSVSPTLSCPSGDVYTMQAGAITMDEVVMAGGKWGTANSSYYLYNGQYYWTMSPYTWSGSYAQVFFVNENGAFGRTDVNWTHPGVRPVINLKADTIIQAGGNGTQSNPYVVS